MVTHDEDRATRNKADSHCSEYFRFTRSSRQPQVRSTDTALQPPLLSQRATRSKQGWRRFLLDMGWCGAGEVAHCEYSNGANSVLFQSSPLYRAMTLMPALAAGSHLLIPCELRRALFLTITQASRYHGRAFVLSRMRLHADTLAASAPPCQMENERAEVIAPMQASARQWQNADRRLGKWLVGGLEERCGLNFVSPVRELGQSPVESNCPLKRTATGRKQERLLGSRWCIAYLHARRRRQCHASARYFR